MKRWAWAGLLAAMTSSAEPLIDVDTVTVPRAQIEALREEHIELKRMILKQREQIATLADGVFTCWSNFRSFRETP